MIFGAVNALQVTPSTKSFKGKQVSFSEKKERTVMPAVMNTNLFSFPGLSSKVKDEKVISRDFRLAAATWGLAAYLDSLEPSIALTLGSFFNIAAVIFCVQLIRIDFFFGEKEFGIKASTAWTGLKERQKTTGENYVLGGKNLWKYKDVVNYECFPKNSPIPILLYFKETGTPKDKWTVGPGRWANTPDALARGAKPGMVHFFPAVVSPQQFKQGFKDHGCPHID
uniref:Uncharacterized protein n=1 Tax=Aureoumbra lagunensis TaxID=44058 RepID=A0A7S3JR13_9STRA